MTETISIADIPRRLSQMQQSVVEMSLKLGMLGMGEDSDLLATMTFERAKVLARKTTSTVMDVFAELRDLVLYRCSIASATTNDVVDLVLQINSVDEIGPMYDKVKRTYSNWFVEFKDVR